MSWGKINGLQCQEPSEKASPEMTFEYRREGRSGRESPCKGPGQDPPGRLRARRPVWLAQ